MIYDSIKNIAKYIPLFQGINKIISFIENNNLQLLENGRYEIDGNKCFALVSEYETKQLSEIIWESHKKYIDLQYIIFGSEKMGFANINQMERIKEYDEIADYALHKGEGSFIIVNQGFFTIFEPSDVHAPQILVKQAENVKKLVFKIQV